ncbi:MAG: NUDIX domain-containing protein [Candidatus Sungbacteria bacterium]|uniref:NUDIX domain-containing protein n=1 Tax=Candidatus Sungiibacteriota bacterium TaxID=2750080 RepID=A0A931SCX2_9BACT|nr:NUDIX domain-containing protein [Candidatus Sungbacteria bacterium]
MGGDINKFLHEVVITAMIVKDGKYLLTRRSMAKKRFPRKWTVPGGKLETSDYIHLPKDTKDYWYNVLEKVLRREVKEEVGIEIENIEYVTSLATIHTDGSTDSINSLQASSPPSGSPSLVVSCLADYVSGEVTLQPEETDQFAWATLDEAKDYDLIDGIYDELVMADKKRLGIKTEWQRF